MELTRREFLKLCRASAIGLGISQLYIPQIVEALEQAAAGRPKVIWLAGASCTGCIVSLANTAHPRIAEILLKIISLQYQSTLMAAAGKLAMDNLYKTAEEAKGKYFLLVEGSIPTKDNGIYCTIGEKDGREITMLEAVKEFGAKSKAIIAVGVCASFGGIPSAKPDPTEAKSVKDILGGRVPIINIPGCPSHPDWIVATIVHVLLYGLPALDGHGRPKIFFLDTVHEKCTYYSYFSEGQLATKFGEKGCLIQLGCKGPMTTSDCPLRRWNSGVNWCIGSDALCIGCCTTNFPDDVSPIYAALPKEFWPVQEKERV